MNKLNKYLLAMPIIALSTMISSITVDAETISAKLQKDYDSCVFKLTFDEASNYPATITSPDGQEFSFEKVSETSMECAVETATKGEWTVFIDTGVEENILTNKVKMSLVTEKETIRDDEKIEVGKDIAGLEYYLKDESLIVEWKDEKCGNVNVKVINLDTLEVLANVTVSSQYFELPLADTVVNISISAVPTSSVNIQGAGMSAVMKIENNPSVKVTYPKQKDINTDNVEIGIVSEKDYGLYVEVNNQEVDVTPQKLVAGDNVIKIPVKNVGNNDIALYVVDENGNMKSFKDSFIKDIEAPILTLKSEYDGISTYDGQFTIEGSISDYHTLFVNEEPVTPTTDGYFSYTATLHIGLNQIYVEAADKAGNKAVYDIMITMLEEEKTDYKPIILIALIGIAFLVITMINKKCREKRALREEPDSEIKPSTKRIKPEKQKKNNQNVATLPPRNPSANTGNRAQSERVVERPSRSDDILIETSNSQQKRNKATHKKPTNRLRKKIELYQFIITAGMVTIFIIVVGCVLLKISYVPTESMKPTVEKNSICVFNQMAYKVRTPERGDIILFTHEENGYKTSYCKRVVGTGGDEIRFVDGYVYINGLRYDEAEYIDEDIETNSNKIFTVPENSYFVLGDNRENSYDSRYWTNPYVVNSDIKAKLIYCIK